MASSGKDNGRRQVASSVDRRLCRGVETRHDAGVRAIGCDRGDGLSGPGGVAMGW